MPTAEVHPPGLGLRSDDARLSARVQIVSGDQGFSVAAVCVAVFVALEERDLLTVTAAPSYLRLAEDLHQ